MNHHSRYTTIVTASWLFIAGQALAAGNPGADSGSGNAEKPAPQAAQQHQHGRGPKHLTLSIADGAKVELWKPDLSRQPAQLHHGKVTFKGTGTDNYHAFVAKHSDGELQQSAIRYEYAFGKPSGHSSTELTAVNKSVLEIVPQPIPREHYHYHSDQEWSFMVRYQGKPLPDQPVSLATAHGSQLSAKTDANGMVTLHLPDDFPQVVAGERDKREAEFTVMTRYSDAGTDYQNTLNASYRLNPQHWHSLPLGVLVVGIGMLTGGWIGRRGLTKTKKGKPA